MNTDDLIAQLSATAGPVRRLAPPMTRALLWLVVIAVLAAIPILLRSDLPVFAQRASDPRMALELFATLATGVAGVIAAFHLSIPDRPRAWALLPAPFALLWMALTGWGCLEFLPEQDQRGWGLGQSHYCFFFLLSVGLPLAGLLILTLRRASPLQPRLVASVGALGVAGLAAFILQFFHPFDVTVMDLATHLASLIVLIAVFSLSGRLTLARAL
jgi:hypothetical protein